MYHGAFWRRWRAFRRLFHWNQGLAPKLPAAVSGALESPSRRCSAIDISRRREYDSIVTGNCESLDIPRDWLEEFEAAARRPLLLRWRYAFVHTYKPVLDDASYRSFDSTEEYRRWCDDNLPVWLGYATV